MRRSTPLALIASLATTVLLLLCPAAPVLAGDDDDVPGVPLAIGVSISQSVDTTDPDDVYAVELTAGHEVYIRCDPGESYSGEGYIHLLVPGAPTIDRPEEGDEISFGPVMGGIPYQTKHGGYFHYIPAVSGTYYLWVEWTAGTLPYKLSVERTQRTLILTPDSDDLPGTRIGPGTVTGVVATLADHYDVYAVQLTAGQAATIELKAYTSLESYFVSSARLSLLSPAATTVDETSSVLVSGPKEVTNATSSSVSIQYTPRQSGAYYVVVEAGPFGDSSEGADFAYTLTTSGNAPVAKASFSDVPSDHPYYAAIVDLASRGIILGYAEDGTFRPSAPVTRQQFAKMIVKTLGLPVSGSEHCPFTDVAVQTGTDPLYPSKYVAVCAGAKIALGYDATSFRPELAISHQQLISMVTRAAAVAGPPVGYDPGFVRRQFSSDEHYLNACKAAYAGLLEGLQEVGSSYDFLAASTRGECAQILYNLSRR